MEHLGNVSDVYSPWRDIDSFPRESPQGNSDLILDSNDCRSYNLYVEEEGVTEVELRVTGVAGIDVYCTAPKSIFHRHII